MITTDIYYYRDTDVEITTFTDDEGNDFVTYDFIVDGINCHANSAAQAKATIDKFKDQR